MGSTTSGELISINLSQSGQRLTGKLDYPQTGESFSIVGTYDPASGAFSLVQEGNSGGINIVGKTTTRMKGTVKRSAGGAAAGFAAKKR